MKAAILSLFLFTGFAVLSQQLETVIQQGHELSVLNLAISPDSGYVVTTSKDKSAKLWDLSTGREVRSYLGHTASVTAAAFSHDANTLITGSNDKYIRIWDVASGKETGSIFTGQYISDLSVDPGSRFFVVAGDKESGNGDSVIVFDWKSRKEITRLSVNPDKGSGVGITLDVSGDGKYLLIGEDNRRALLYETGSWRLLKAFEYAEGYCGGCGTFVAFAPDNKSFFYASQNSILKRVSVPSFETIHEYKGEEIDDITGLAISNDGKSVALAMETQVRLYEVSSGNQKHVLNAREKAHFHDIEFSLDNKTLMLGSDDNTVIRWNYHQNKILAPLSGFLASRDLGGLDYDPNFYWQSHIARYIRLKNPLLISRDGKTLFKGKFGSKVRQWDIATGRSVMDFTGHKKAVLSYDLSADGKKLLTGGGDGKIILWDVAKGDSLKVIESYREPIFDIHFNSDETMALSSSWDGTMRIHDLSTGKVSSYFSLDNSSAYTVLFHPTDLYVVTARLDNSLQMWEIDTRTVVRSFTGHTGVISSMRISKDQSTLFTGAWDGTIRYWDIGTGLMRKKIVHSNTAVHAILLSPDENLILSAGADRMIKVWEQRTGKLLKTLAGHKAEVTSLLFSPDGKMLISHSVDGVTKFWNFESGNEFFEHIHLGDHDWLVKNSDGYFSGTDGARKYVHFVKGVKTFSVDQFFNEFYRPELLPKIFQSRGGSEQKGVEGKLRKSPPPTVKIAALPLGENKAEVFVRMINEGAGISSLRILHNGKSLPLDKERLTFPDKVGEVSNYKQEVDLIGGNNTFTAIAVNKDNVESDPRSVELFTESEVKHSVCHVLVVGINEYSNAKLNLNYAKPDAESFGKIVDEHSASLFKNVRMHALYDKQANRENILKKLDELKTEIHPEDVFIFYYAGHGSMVDNKFYFIPTNNLRLYDQGELEKDALEASIVQEKLKEISALKQLIVMDACQSGGSVELLATRGASEEKAIAQLSRSTGVHVLASAGSEQFATEFAELQHGLFTYVLLKGLDGDADGAPKDGKVTIYELKSYIDDQVPEMTRKMKGKPQYPYTFSRGQDFPVVMKP
jgi:WD40 repeat protein